MPEEPIYSFPKFKDALQKKGYTIGDAKPYVPLQVADVNLSSIQNGEVEITDDGIFYVNPVTGSKHEVFLYKRNYNIAQYGKPRFHVRNCEAIQEIGRDQYRRANTGKVMVWDRSQGKDVEVDELPLCGYCRSILIKEGKLNYRTSDNFEEVLRQANEEASQHEDDTDFSGYIWKWEKVSMAYRTHRDFTCERCGYKATSLLGRRDLDVHHRDGNKLHNTEDNFECLCVACHANVDDRHRKNFSKGAAKKRLDRFLKEHPEAGHTQKNESGGDLPF